MKHILILLITCSACILCYAQSNNSWQQAQEPMMEGKECKWDENIRYFFNADVKPEDRDTMISKCREYVKDNLAIIGEKELKDTIDIVFIRDRDEMYIHMCERIAGTVVSVEDEGKNIVFCIYNEPANPIKHELMHMAILCKWGKPRRGHYLAWLSEGLATYSDPDSECDGYPFEEKYAVFLQNSRLASIDLLLNNFREVDNYTEIKIRYHQSAYMVQYMISNYGIGKVKKLWQSGMRNFEKIFGKKIEEMLVEIEDTLTEKYPSSIPFDWNRFEERCY